MLLCSVFEDEAPQVQTQQHRLIECSRSGLNTRSGGKPYPSCPPQDLYTDNPEVLQLVECTPKGSEKHYVLYVVYVLKVSRYSHR